MIEPILLKSLSEQYARRAREFSDSVALLGRHNSVGPEVLKLFKKIKRQSEMCGDAEEKLGRYVKQEIEDSRSPERDPTTAMRQTAQVPRRFPLRGISESGPRTTHPRRPAPS
jgi:hypothetical protein